MKFLRWLHILAILTLLSACNAGATEVSPNNPTASLPPPIVTIWPGGSPEAPNPETTTTPDGALTAYLDAFKAEDYNSMYGLLSKVSQDAIKLEDFAKRNRDALNEMSASSFDYQILSSLKKNDYSSEVSFHITYHTALVGDLQRDIVAPLALENNTWKLKWDDGLILPELAGGNVLRMEYNIPSRGNIYDRNGDALVAQSDAYAFYILPGNVTNDSIGPLASEASRLCGIDMQTLIDKINTYPAQYPIPLCIASEQESQRLRGIAPSGLYWETSNLRYYFDQGASSNVVG